MIKKAFIRNAMLLMTALVVVLSGCKKEDDDEDQQTEFKMNTIEAGSIDMNGATPPSDVPADAVITATFSTAIDASTATNTNIKLTRGYDDVEVAIDISVSGNTLTVTPTENLGSGTLYTLLITSGLKSTDGQGLVQLTRSFTTAGAFVPSGQVAYFKFEDNTDDETGNYNPIEEIDISFVDSKSESMGKAAAFNGNTSLIRIPNGDMIQNTNDFTLAFWMKANPVDHGLFVMGLSAWFGFQFEVGYNGDENTFPSCKLAAQYEFADGSTGSEDLWFAGDGNLGWQGWTFSKDLTGQGGVNALLRDKWAHIVCRYDSESKIGTMYINGEKMKEQDFNLWPEGDPKYTTVGLKWNGAAGNNTFVLGFIQDYENPTVSDDWADYTDPDNNHFDGILDDVAIYHRALTEQEISLMADAK